MPPYGYSGFPPSSSPTNNAAYSSPTRPQAKRKQVKNACTNCQKACKKCDDHRPCSRCVKYGIGATCVNSQRKERKRKDQSQSQSEISSPLSSLSRSGREARLAQRYREAVRSSTRNIRTFSQELLQSLQDEDGLDDDYDEDSGCFEERRSDPAAPTTETLSVSEEFKALAQLCSDLHTKIQHAMLVPQYPAPPPPQMVSQFSYPPCTPLVSSPYYPQQQTYPTPSPSYTYHRPPAQQAIDIPIVNNNAAFIQQHLHQRTLMNRTPPEELPSPVKSDDGSSLKFEPQSGMEVTYQV